MKLNLHNYVEFSKNTKIYLSVHFEYVKDGIVVKKVKCELHST